MIAACRYVVPVLKSWSRDILLKGLDLGEILEGPGLKARSLGFKVSFTSLAAGSGSCVFFVRIGPIRFMAGCRKRQLNQD